MIKKQAKPIYSGSDTAQSHIRKSTNNHIFVLTAAQNNTEIDKVMFGALMQFCAHEKATLLIGKLNYNKNSYNEIWWAPELQPYLVDQHIELSKKWHFLAHANIIPTAKNPLNGLSSSTSNDVNFVVPASKIQLKTGAVFGNSLPKIMCSTGTVTKRNYILRKAGVAASNEHSIAAIYVNTKTGDIRQLELMPKEKGFAFEKRMYTPNKVWEDDNLVLALNLGDIHAEQQDTKDVRRCKKLIKKYDPTHVIIHDLMDFNSCNHHSIKDCSHRHLQNLQSNSVERDVLKVSNFLRKIIPVSNFVHIIESNHDLAINQWLKDTDFKVDPTNAVLYLRCMLALYEHQKVYGNSDFNMLKFVVETFGKLKSSSVIYHTLDESIIMASTEFGCHGHLGIKGSRGSPQQFRNYGIPMNTGHTHAPSINGLVYTAGVSVRERLPYTRGSATDNRVAHILTYINGQRTIIFD